MAPVIVECPWCTKGFARDGSDCIECGGTGEVDAERLCASCFAAEPLPDATTCATCGVTDCEDRDVDMVSA